MNPERLRQAMRSLPYWWEAAPRPQTAPGELPDKADVVIVGSGFTGLSAALTLCRAGRDVVVLERESPGWGASSRNQGHVASAFKRGISELIDAYGKTRAVRLFKEGQAAVEFCKTLIEKEGIDCHLEKRGRLLLAWTPAHYEALAKEIRQRVALCSLEADVITRDEARAQVASAQYHGGVLMHREATLHGALYHLGLLKIATEAGAAIVSGTEVRRIEGATASFKVETSRGPLSARNVLIATNAYTDCVDRALSRRIVPVNSFGIATDILDADQIDEVLPGRRAGVDTLKLSHGFRVAPGENRIIFGTRPPYRETNPERGAARLHAQMLRVFPQLEGVQITHAWTGNVGFPFDFLPHLGCRGGVHYAMGYGGTGVALATYLGHKIALRILGDVAGESVFSELAFQSRPFYTGHPWFLGAVLRYYGWLDKQAK